MTTETRDISALIEQISNLDIDVSRTPEGCYTVCSLKEPLFSYDAGSLEEIQALVADTVVSYAKHFFLVDLPGFSTESHPIDSDLLPVEHLTPVSRLKPVFDLAA